VLPQVNFFACCKHHSSGKVRSRQDSEPFCSFPPSSPSCLTSSLHALHPVPILRVDQSACEGQQGPHGRFSHGIQEEEDKEEVYQGKEGWELAPLDVGRCSACSGSSRALSCTPCACTEREKAPILNETDDGSAKTAKSPSLDLVDSGSFCSHGA